jgi:hypothetical protein
MESFFVFALLMAMICGALGAFIAGLKGVSTAAGIILGALLGPIGLIIVALLTPPPVVIAAAPTNTTLVSYDGEPDLRAGRYRLWLVEKYGVTRNEVMNVYAVRGEPFDSLDAAVEYAHGIEAMQAEEQTAAEKKRLDDQVTMIRRREAVLAEERASDNTTVRIILIVVGVIVGGLVLFLLMSSFAAL